MLDKFEAILTGDFSKETRYASDIEIFSVLEHFQARAVVARPEKMNGWDASKVILIELPSGQQLADVSKAGPVDFMFVQSSSHWDAVHYKCPKAEAIIQQLEMARGHLTPLVDDCAEMRRRIVTWLRKSVIKPQPPTEVTSSSAAMDAAGDDGVAVTLGLAVKPKPHSEEASLPAVVDGSSQAAPSPATVPPSPTSITDTSVCLSPTIPKEAPAKFDVAMFDDIMYFSDGIMRLGRVTGIHGSKFNVEDPISKITYQVPRTSLRPVRLECMPMANAFTLGRRAVKASSSETAHLGFLSFDHMLSDYSQTAYSGQLNMWCLSSIATCYLESELRACG